MRCSRLSKYLQSFPLVMAFAWTIPTMADTSLKIQEWQQKGGATILFVPVKQLPMVDVSVTLRTGSIDDGTKKGLSNLAAELVGKTVKGYTRSEFSEAVDFTGAEFNVSSNSVTTTLSFRSLSDEKVLSGVESLMARALSQSKPTKDDFNQIKSSIVQNLVSEKSDPGKQGFEKAFELLFEGHPYSFPSSGTIESLKKITLREVLSFQSKRYSKSDSLVVIVGDVSKARAKKLADRLLSKLPATPVSTVASVPNTKKSNKPFYVDFPSEQTHVLFAIQSINQKSDKFYPLLIANHIFGGNGFSSRLMKKIRSDEGLAYSAYSGLQPLYNSGVLYINVQTKNESRDRVLEIIDEQLLEMRNMKVTKAEFNFAKENLINQESSITSSNRKIASLCKLIGLYDLPRNYLDLRSERLEAVTLKDAVSAWNSTFTENHVVKVIVGKK